MRDDACDASFSDFDDSAGEKRSLEACDGHGDHYIS